MYSYSITPDFVRRIGSSVSSVTRLRAERQGFDSCQGQGLGVVHCVRTGVSTQLVSTGERG